MTDRTVYMREYMRKRRTVNRIALKFKDKTVNRPRRHFSKEIEEAARTYHVSPTMLWMMRRIEESMLPEHYKWLGERIMAGDRVPKTYLLYKLSKCSRPVRDAYMDALIRFHADESLNRFLVKLLKEKPEHIENIIVRLMEPAQGDNSQSSILEDGQGRPKPRGEEVIE